jgi:hypothetical protein
MSAASPREKPASKAHLYAASLAGYVSDSVAPRLWSKQVTKVWALWDLKPTLPEGVPPRGGGPGIEPEPEAEAEARAGSGVETEGKPGLPAPFHVRRVPLLWLRYGLVDKQLVTVVTFDDGDGVVRQLLSRRGSCSEAVGEEQLEINLAGRPALLTLWPPSGAGGVSGALAGKLMPSKDAQAYSCLLTLGGEGGGEQEEVPLYQPGRPPPILTGGERARDPLSESALQECVSIAQTRLVPRYTDAAGLSQGEELAVEYEVRLRLGGKVGGLRALPEDLTDDGQASCTNDTFMHDRGAYTISRWHRYSDFHSMHLNFMSCFVGADKASIKRVPSPPPKTWRPKSSAQPSFIESRRRGLEDYLKALLHSTAASATTNPYLLDFLGLVPSLQTHPPSQQQRQQQQAVVWSHQPVLVAVTVQRPSTLKHAPPTPSRTTSAEHKAHMSRHYSADRLSRSRSSSNAGAEGASIDSVPEVAESAEEAKDGATGGAGGLEPATAAEEGGAEEEENEEPAMDDVPL